VVHPNRRRGVRYRALVRCKIRAGVAKDSAEIGFLEVDDVIDVVSTATEAGVKRIQFNKKWRGADGQERMKLGWVSVVTAGGKELLADRAREAEEEERVAALDAERKRREEAAKRARERREAEEKRRAEEKRLLEQEAARPERQISCQNLLKRVEQVFPVEAPTPASLRSAELRPYQRQSLAFMLELEKAPAGAETVGAVRVHSQFRSPMTGGTYPVRGGWLVRISPRSSCATGSR